LVRAVVGFSRLARRWWRGKQTKVRSSAGHSGCPGR
jgi:hypothetical protein